MAPILGYWEGRSICQPIRLLLHYVGKEFEDKHYTTGPPPEYSRDSWFKKEKFNIGLDFPNLPYYIDGDIKITQSSAILRHIARKKNLCGETEKEKIIVDMLDNQIVDFWMPFFALTYDKEAFEEEKPKYLEVVAPKIKAFGDFLGEKKFLAGEKITFVDFMLYEALYHHKVLEASLLEQHANLKAYLDRIEITFVDLMLYETLDHHKIFDASLLEPHANLKIAEGIFYLLNYTKTEYETMEYVTGDGPEYNKDCWFSVKENLGLPFPNLPYYIDGDLKLTQSIAIMRHIAGKHDLCGKTVEQKALSDCIALESLDFLIGFIKATYSCQNFEEDIKTYLKNIRVNVKRYSTHLAENPYMTGQTITFADFIFWEVMDQLRTLDPTVFDEHQNLKNYMKRIAELPGMKEYLVSQEARGRPISNKMAKWGAKFIPRPTN